MNSSVKHYNINKITNINHCRCYSSPGPFVDCGGGPNGPEGDWSSSMKLESPEFCVKFGGGLYWGSPSSAGLASGGSGPDAGTELLGLSESLLGNGGGFTWPDAAVPSGPVRKDFINCYRC